MGKRIQSYDYAKALLVLLVVLHHSLFAYIVSLKYDVSTILYDLLPMSNLVNPVIDSVKWIGFDIILTINDVYFMSAFFFISGLFIRGANNYLKKRFRRLMVPFILGVLTIIPLAFYAGHLQYASSLSFIEFWLSFVQHGFFTSGHLWFLWLLFAFTAILYLVMPYIKKLPKVNVWLLSASMVLIHTILYLPLRNISAMIGIGPFLFQGNRLLPYFFFFVIGYLLSEQKSMLYSLRKYWYYFALIGLVSIPYWFSLASVCLVFALIGFSSSLPKNLFFDLIAKYAFGVYIIHYLFTSWLQYLLLPLELLAITKGVIVFVLATVLSLGSVVAGGKVLEKVRVVF